MILHFTRNVDSQLNLAKGKVQLESLNKDLQRNALQPQRLNAAFVRNFMLYRMHCDRNYAQNSIK
jgi:hypothetical protein